MNEVLIDNLLDIITEDSDFFLKLYKEKGLNLKGENIIANYVHYRTQRIRKIREALR